MWASFGAGSQSISRSTFVRHIKPNHLRTCTSAITTSWPGTKAPSACLVSSPARGVPYMLACGGAGWSRLVGCGGFGSRQNERLPKCAGSRWMRVRAGWREIGTGPVWTRLLKEAPSVKQGRRPIDRSKALASMTNKQLASMKGSTILGDSRASTLFIPRNVARPARRARGKFPEAGLGRSYGEERSRSRCRPTFQTNGSFIMRCGVAACC